MIQRPRIRLPLWAAVAIIGAAFLARSIVLRGGDFSLDLPSDAIAFVVLAVALAFVAWARRQQKHDEESRQHENAPSTKDGPSSGSTG